MENSNLTPEQVVEKINGMFVEKMASVPTKDDVIALNEQVEALKGLEAKSNEIEKAIAKFEGKLEAMGEKAVTPKVAKKSVRQAIGDTFEANLDAIKDAVAKGGKLNLEVKDTTITGSYTGEFNLTDYDAGIDRIERSKPTIMSISNVGVTSSKFVTYVSQTRSTTIGEVNEAFPKVEGTPTWEEVSEEVKKYAGYIKVSKEMLEDLSFIRGEINGELMTQLGFITEGDLLNGTGGAQVTGLLNQGIQTFVPGTFAGTIPSANISDVIRVAKAQIENNNYMPTHVVLHPEDAAKIQLTKSSTGEYTYPMYVSSPDGMRVAELVVVVSNQIAADTYVVGDFSKFNIRMRNNMALSVGLDQDDFTRNMITILAEARMVCYVKNNAKGAFVTGRLSSDIGLLELVP